MTLFPRLRRDNSGLGDTIASITHATGIAQAVEYVADKLGVDCGCKKRQEALNKLVPYKDVPNDGSPHP